MAEQDYSATEIFEAAIDLPAHERDAYVSRVCQDSPALKREVDGMLNDYERMGNFLDEPVVPWGAAEPSAKRPAPMTAGRKLGRYTILEPLGQGGMGAVYRARDERLERTVAIKVLPAGMLADEDARSRFRKEALALAKLSHAHIAAVYDVGEQDGMDFIVMECVRGETLAARMGRDLLSVKEATSIVAHIAEALEEAHEQGVVHRDLKPANVMMTPKGQVKVLDFGLAKLLEAPVDRQMTVTATGTLLGTASYMSPEQALGKPMDQRTDLWSLGVLYYEMLTGSRPFDGDNYVEVLHAIVKEQPTPLKTLQPDVPPQSEAIVNKALQKDCATRYQTASEMAADANAVLMSMSMTTQTVVQVVEPKRSWLSWVLAGLVVVAVCGASVWFFRYWSQRQWARDEASGQVESLIAQGKMLAAFDVLDKAQGYLPHDATLAKLAKENSRDVSVTSTPAGATVEIQDYGAPDSRWHALGVTPIAKAHLPQGYFLWRVTAAGAAPLMTAPPTDDEMSFSFTEAQAAPKGMVVVPAASWAEYIDFVGFVGPYKLPEYDIDTYEVSNRDYQQFVDSGGYEKAQYWTEAVQQDGHAMSRAQAMELFRDTTGRPGPAGWVAGHYAEGEGDLPVTGVSWYEAAAYAAFAGKSLPALSQWYHAAPPDLSRFVVPVSNFGGKAAARVGAYRGVGPFGTYDMAGNVREWVANSDEEGARFILGGSWQSPAYLYFSPETLSPLDRSAQNGFRCVKNASAIPPDALKPIKRATRDFAHYKPVPDSVFHAYEVLYDYDKTAPLHATEPELVEETADWREEKVVIDTAYRGERMAVYVFLPKHVQPPYQAALFFPSARVLFLRDNDNGKALGDTKFFDYVVQSGRAVIYPVYEDMYERRVKYSLPSGSQDIHLTTEWYKDAARSLDYLVTRKDIDASRLAYLGVSMGSADGVIIATLMQDRLKTSVWLDGGFFLDYAPPGGDQADFAPRMKKPVLMVNGRYDYVFAQDRAQDPLFNMLGTAAKDKKHLVLETPHDVTEDRPHLVRGVVDWMDTYLGHVNEPGK